MKDAYLRVGNYTPRSNTHAPIIERGFYGQGWVVKDEDAFLHHPDQVCYVPELSDEVYTQRDLLTLCNGQADFARQCFYALDWQHPTTWIDEQLTMDEWAFCPRCKLLYDMAGNESPCPLCDAAPNEKGEMYGNSENRGKPPKSCNV